MSKLVALFSDPDFLNQVPCEKILYPANSVILQEDDQGQELFLINSGEVEVSYKLNEDEHLAPARLTRLKAKEFFGELSVFDSGPRSAQVIAVADCEVFKVNGPKLIAYLDAHPAKGYFVLRELFMHVVKYMRLNNLRTKLALELYFHEHADD